MSNNTCSNETIYFLPLEPERLDFLPLEPERALLLEALFGEVVLLFLALVERERTVPGIFSLVKKHKSQHHKSPKF